MKYWINTISKDHVMIGKEKGIVQAGHGKKAPLQKLHKDDYVIFYSPKTSSKDGELLQSFTAIAQIKDDQIYQVGLTDNFKPFRRNTVYLDCKEAPIHSLIEKLEFTVNKKSWGYKFRFGLFGINRKDFLLIAKAMEAKTI